MHVTAVTHLGNCNCKYQNLTAWTVIEILCVKFKTSVNVSLFQGYYTTFHSCISMHVTAVTRLGNFNVKYQNLTAWIVIEILCVKFKRLLHTHTIKTDKLLQVFFGNSAALSSFQNQCFSVILLHRCLVTLRLMQIFNTHCTEDW